LVLVDYENTGVKRTRYDSIHSRLIWLDESDDSEEKPIDASVRSHSEG